MISTDLFVDVQRQMAEDFQSQNPELFDTVFEIEGKKLYAHKYHLSLVSPTFKAMLSDRCNTNKNDAIAIKGDGYDNFKELLTFIYSGKCNLTDTNIFTTLDMAEFYQINHLKKYCDLYLSMSKIDISNLFQLMELSNKYSLLEMKQEIRSYITMNFTTVIESQEFLEADKAIIEEIVIYSSTTIFVKREELFQAVYQWAEYQAIMKFKQSNNETFSMNDVIRNGVATLLPYIEFKKMHLNFLNTFVVERSFIFSDDELSDILNNAEPEVRVKVTNTNQQTIIGTLPCDSEAIIVMQSLKDISAKFYVSLQLQYIWWKIGLKAPPSSPSLLKKKDGIKWYLIYFRDGDIGVRKSSNIDPEDYLLAEMTSVDGFTFTEKCKIEID